MRIIAGRFRGKKLKSPPDQSIRPTTDRVRESLFNILASRIGPDFAGQKVLDLFAGTGALGLEALSRGADQAILVDTGVEARGLIREHIEQLGLAGNARLLRRDATNLGGVGTMHISTLVFCDPPYGEGLGEKALASARDGGWIAPGATIVLEERKGVEVEIPDGFELLDQRDYADTAIHLMSYESSA